MWRRRKFLLGGGLWVGVWLLCGGWGGLVLFFVGVCVGVFDFFVWGFLFGLVCFVFGFFGLFGVCVCGWVGLWGFGVWVCFVVVGGVWWCGVVWGGVWWFWFVGWLWLLGLEGGLCGGCGGGVFLLFCVVVCWGGGVLCFVWWCWVFVLGVLGGFGVVLWLWGGVEWKWVGCWGLFVLWGGGVGGFEDMMVGRECIGLCGGKFGWRGVVWGVGGMKIGDMGVVGVVWVGLGVGDGVFGWCWCWVVVLGFCLGLNLGDLVIVGFGKGFLGVFVFIVVVGGLVFVVVVLCWVVGCVCCGLGDGVGVFVVVRSGLVLCFFLLVGD
uniref:Uncharacterized protein n=1 Tax=Knipowitschia caucasica TaxID=637954 RepID=A0AAV2L2Y8_KNICA